MISQHREIIEIDFPQSRYTTSGAPGIIALSFSGGGIRAAEECPSSYVYYYVLLISRRGKCVLDSAPTAALRDDKSKKRFQGLLRRRLVKLLSSNYPITASSPAEQYLPG